MDNENRPDNEWQNDYGYNDNGQWNGYDNYQSGRPDWNRQEKKNAPMGITSMVLGIIALIFVCCCYIMSIPIGIAAVVFGIVSLKKQEPYMGFAVAGIVTGALGCIFAVMVTILANHMVQTGVYDEIMREIMQEMETESVSLFR